MNKNLIVLFLSVLFVSCAHQKAANKVPVASRAETKKLFVDGTQVVVAIDKLDGDKWRGQFSAQMPIDIKVLGDLSELYPMRYCEKKAKPLVSALLKDTTPMPSHGVEITTQPTTIKVEWSCNEPAIKNLTAQLKIKKSICDHDSDSTVRKYCDEYSSTKK